jgi:zinc/manganese transport system substrate-binding protein
MKQLDADNAQTYQQGLDDFSQRWTAAVAGWEKLALPLRGKKVIAHLEPVPGIPPTAGHLASLLDSFGDNNGADFIIRAPFQSEKPSKWLSERTGIPAVLLPLSVGGTDQSSDLFKWFDDILDRLLTAREAK